MGQTRRAGTGDASSGHLSSSMLCVVEVVLCSLVLAASLLAYGGFFPKVRFTSERIHVRIDPNRLHVCGLYRYRNDLPFAVTQGLSCPAPSEDGLGPVEFLLAERLDPTGRCHGILPVRVMNGTVLFEVTVPADSEVEVRVRYGQSHRGKLGRYILTTTAPWGRPLQRGRYELETDGVSFVESNYPLEQECGQWVFEKADFMPDRDWIFEFACEEDGT